MTSTWKVGDLVRFNNQTRSTTKYTVAEISKKADAVRLKELPVRWFAARLFVAVDTPAPAAGK